MRNAGRILRVVLALLAMYAAIGAPFAVHLVPGW